MANHIERIKAKYIQRKERKQRHKQRKQERKAEKQRGKQYKWMRRQYQQHACDITFHWNWRATNYNRVALVNFLVSLRGG